MASTRGPAPSGPARRGRRARALAAGLLVAAASVVAAGPATAQASADPTVPLPPAPEATALPGGQRAGAAPEVRAQSGGSPLRGVFRLREGTCAAAGVTAGSWFRMAQPNGNPQSGPWVSNGDSACGDKSWTPLTPGSDGGLSTVAHQPHPDPAFDGAGGGTAGRITAPQRFFGVNFATASNATDPQTGASAPVPSVLHDGSGRLSGDLRAFAAAWNRQHFNQGSPKPDGSRPGATTAVTGTYEAGSGRFTLQWASTIVGGPFNNFTGVWHLEGTFSGTSTATSQPSPAPAPPGPSTAGPPALGGAPAAPAGVPGAARATGGFSSTGLANTGPPAALALAPVLLAGGATGLGALAVTRRRRRP